MEIVKKFELETSLDYLHKVCMEAMRLHPPVRVSGMYETTEEIRLYEIEKPVIFPKGTKFLLNYVAINQNLKDKRETKKFTSSLVTVATADWIEFSLS